ncbi:ferredoxin family protein [Trueperella sp. LYQ143]|uniref:ferredoxin family protein n=1 Tax=unclassified Trueperella TaxID=2630174 RepID=UPI003983958F
MSFNLDSVNERLARNVFHTDDESHIEVDQEAARRTRAGELLERICPAHVYQAHPDGTIGVEYAACLECGTCLRVAPPGVLRWIYPTGASGVHYREG